MRNSLLSFALIAGLFLPIGAIHAQGTDTVTATCKDGTAFTGTKRSGACRGHGGVQSWGSAAATTGPVSTPSQPAAQPAPTRSQGAAPAPTGAGQVWVNTSTKVYLSLPRHPMVRQDQAGHLHVRGAGQGAGR